MTQVLKLFVALVGAVSVVSAFAQPSAADADVRPTPASDYSNVKLYERWEADSTPGTVASQCKGRAYGEIVTGFGEWSDVIRIATNDAVGGCVLQLAVVDPDGVMKGWNLQTELKANGDAGQCHNTGMHSIPIVKTVEQARTSGLTLGLDTDDRPGGCLVTFFVKSPGPQLAVYFAQEGSLGPNDDGCWMTGKKIARQGEPASIGINADNNRSPCLLQFSLFSPERGLKPVEGLAIK